MEFTQLENVISMLQSPDKENHVVALNIMEAQKEKVMIPLLLCYKFGKAEDKVWIDNAPKTYAYINKIPFLKKDKLRASKITFKLMFDLIIKEKAPASEMSLFLKYFSKFLLNQCTSTGYTFIEDIEIKVKTPSNDQ